ncbi:MAG: hypothetical protein F6J89_11840, partial [Symploca sp. SIO1C4]|nr:hypothetical protein [Symploca sp. SIO1C4]
MKNRSLIILMLALGWSILISACDVAPSSSEHQNQSLVLPTFESAQQLAESPWQNYFNKVYGNSPTSASQFPIDLNDWWIFYKDDLAGIKTIPCEDFGGNHCPIPKTQEGQAICSLSGGDHDLPNAVYIYHAPPYSPLRESKWVEFTHTADAEAKNNEKVGSWMYYMPGSGNYFHLGKTKAFSDHPEAVKHFLNKNCNDLECAQYFTDLFKAAASKGYDSIQFLKHHDMTCAQNIAIEIVDVAGSGMYACGE